MRHIRTTTAPAHMTALDIIARASLAISIPFNCIVAGMLMATPAHAKPATLAIAAPMQVEFSLMATAHDGNVYAVDGDMPYRECTDLARTVSEIEILQNVWVDASDYALHCEVQ